MTVGMFQLSRAEVQIRNPAGDLTATHKMVQVSVRNDHALARQGRVTMAEGPCISLVRRGRTAFVGLADGSTWEIRRRGG